MNPNIGAINHILLYSQNGLWTRAGLGLEALQEIVSMCFIGL